MAWNVERCEVSVESRLGLVQPATEFYADEAIAALKAGKVIAVPTDTLYGFACDAWYLPALYNFPCLLHVKNLKILNLNCTELYINLSIDLLAS